MNNELEKLVESIHREEEQIRLGGGQRAIERQHAKGRLTARERIDRLLDPGTSFFELGLWAAWGMYREWGGAPAAGVVTGIGRSCGRQVMVIANDATVKAGAFFPMTCKKVLRAQRIAMDNRLPLVYLVDSAGVFLPLQDEVFPDEDDFGRIFRNNAVISAMGVPQFAAILGNCVAGGGYLPVLCDKLLMTEGQRPVSGGAGAGEGGHRPERQPRGTRRRGHARHHLAAPSISAKKTTPPASIVCAASSMLLPPDAGRVSMDIAARPADGGSACTCSRRTHGRSTTCAICCRACSMRGRSTSTRRSTARRWCAATAGSAACRSASSPISTSAAGRPAGRCSTAAFSTSIAPTRRRASSWTAIRADCRLLFLQDVNGFMVGRDSEQAGIIRAGAKLVNVIANSVVPKITVILGGSFGAGNYALCGKAFDPRFMLRLADGALRRHGRRSGGQHAAGHHRQRHAARQGNEPEAEELEELRRKIEASYQEQTDVRYAAARLWVDRIVAPGETRLALLTALAMATRHDDGRPFRTGVLQV